MFQKPGLRRLVASQRHIRHVRTRKKSPWTNGVIGQFFGAVKYEQLYRHDIGDGEALARHVDDYRTICISIRPHEAIGMARPMQRYRQTPQPNIPDQKPVSDT